VISSSQGLYLNTGQHKHRINTHTPNIHALYGIRIHDSSFRASEDSLCLRPLGYCDRLRRNILPSISDSYPEDGGKTFIRNVGKHLPHYMESLVSRLQPYYPLPGEARMPLFPPFIHWHSTRPAGNSTECLHLLYRFYWYCLQMNTLITALSLKHQHKDEAGTTYV
jgi:hypothetical protein